MFLRNLHTRIVSVPSYEAFRDPRYAHLNPEERDRVQRYFAERIARTPWHAWIQTMFLRMVEAATGSETPAKFGTDEIEPIQAGHASAPTNQKSWQPDQIAQFEATAASAIRNGHLMVIDLVAGMATGFGGTAKAAVDVAIDRRWEERHVTYYDYKLRHILTLQREMNTVIPLVAMVSDATENAVRENLEKFERDNNVKLIIIPEGASRADVQSARRRTSTQTRIGDNIPRTLVVKIVKQPSIPHVSKDGTRMGPEYMKGHGDLYAVIQSQLREFIDVFGVEDIFVSNIDNTGGLVDKRLYGYFRQRAEMGELEALVEVAKKKEGDKGGGLAKVQGRPGFLERANVPDELLDAYNGTETFPFFNTNTMWFRAASILGREFNLPLRVSSVVDHPDAPGNPWLKFENAMVHGLDLLKWATVLIERGERFMPDKYLVDLWIKRAWALVIHGRILPPMRDGKFINPPLIQIGKNTFRDVDEMNHRLFEGGAFDSMGGLRTMLIGGSGDGFDTAGDYKTSVRVRYSGDVMIIFGQESGKTPGKLIIQGNGLTDEIQIRDCVIYVPAGETLIIDQSMDKVIDDRVSGADIRGFLKNATQWTVAERERVLRKFLRGPSTDSGLPRARF